MAVRPRTAGSSEKKPFDGGKNKKKEKKKKIVPKRPRPIFSAAPPSPEA
jgi:hypothetical protein